LNEFGEKKTTFAYQKNFLFFASKTFTFATQSRGSKQYELTDHLGNIRTVVPDIKEPLSLPQNQNFRLPTLTLNNYYPYGMLQAGRSKHTDEYRFGFQGQEADNKIGGLGQHLNYTFRNYDSWAIRFGAIDPLAGKYPYWSPFAFSGNRVIDMIELEGAETYDPSARPTGITYISKATVPPGIIDFSTHISAGKYTLYWVKPADETQGLPYWAAIRYDKKGEHYDWVVGIDAIRDFRDASDNLEAAIQWGYEGKSNWEMLKEQWTFEKVSMGFLAAVHVYVATVPVEMEMSSIPKGRLGNAATRQQNSNIATELENRGYTITGGGGRMPEEYLKPPAGQKKGGSYPDITATKNGRTLRVNTVDTKKNGKPTKREANNAARIRNQKPGDHLLLVPKK
jgi:RHS repeat-associated protein